MKNKPEPTQYYFVAPADRFSACTAQIVCHRVLGSPRRDGSIMLEARCAALWFAKVADPSLLSPTPELARDAYIRSHTGAIAGAKAKLARLRRELALCPKQPRVVDSP